MGGQRPQLQSSCGNDLLTTLRGPIETRDELDEADLWSTHGAPIWRARGFRGAPGFYPVYRCGELYSHSPLPLILHKGYLRIDRRTARRVARPGFIYASGRRTIDRDIVRLGRPARPTFAITREDDYAHQLADAMSADIRDVEARHPGYANVVLCGGRDSLTLLLLPWSNPVVVASAAPNHPLVEAFVREHRLNMPVVQLDDEDGSLLGQEILANCCRNALEHCRWAPALRRLSAAFDGRVIFWKGQLGSMQLTPYWAKYCHPPYALVDLVRNLCRPLRSGGERTLLRLLADSGATQRVTVRSLWRRGAMWQGAHMSMLRQLTNALVLSGYHGPAARRVMAAVDFRRAVTRDVRPLLAETLYGRPVRFPDVNPGPPLSQQRRGVSHLAPFVRELARIGVAVR
jgi:hypothetical protein